MFRNLFQIRKAVRATLILFPLLGITNLLFFINPKSLQRKEHEYIYMLVNSVLKSSQVRSSQAFKHHLIFPGNFPLLSLLLLQHRCPGDPEEISPEILDSSNRERDVVQVGFLPV